MKRLIALFLCLLSTALLMTSCGDAATPSGTSSASPSQATTATTRSTSSTTAASTTQYATRPTTANSLPGDSEVIAKVPFDEQMIEGYECDEMYLYSKTDFIMDGQKATAELYVDSEPNEKGILFWQDGQTWSLLIRQGEDVYPLIDKKWVQLGFLKYYLLTEETDCNQDNLPVKVVLFWATDMGMYAYEYGHQPMDKQFVMKKIYDTDDFDFLAGYSKGDVPMIYEGP